MSILLLVWIVSLVVKDMFDRWCEHRERMAGVLKDDDEDDATPPSGPDRT